MKVAIILCSNIWFAPYISPYVQLLKGKGIDYDIISWNRDGADAPQGVQFNKQMPPRPSKYKKVSLFAEYIRFVKREVVSRQYDKLIVSSPQVAVMMAGFLKRRYEGNYIIDYRDLSVEQNRFLMPLFEKSIKYSYANVLSSPGFMKCLPKGYMYYISHNFDAEKIYNCLEQPYLPCNYNGNNVILTIGGIRDYSSNIEVVNALANKPDFIVKFVGKGTVSDRIQDYAEVNHIENLRFEGYYPKEKEAGYILESTFLNIFYPVKISHSTALSNRFYNSLLYKKPMIVTTNSIQGDYAEKYQLGLSLENCDNLAEQIKAWYKDTDYSAFCERCNNLLREFLKDYEELKKMLEIFLTT